MTVTPMASDCGEQECQISHRGSDPLLDHPAVFLSQGIYATIQKRFAGSSEYLALLNETWMQQTGGDFRQAPSAEKAMAVEIHP